jgi:ubiquinone/menaquinone biosynthesis C-methylase UbiE
MQIVDRQFDAYQSFLLGGKLFWTGRIYPELYALYRRKAEEFAQQRGRMPQDAEEVAGLLKGEMLTQVFGWAERHLQRLKYSGRWGLQTVHDRHRAEIRRELDADFGDVLKLDPNLAYPGYFTEVDIHQHPGGIWSDEIAGAVYERGARSTTPLLERDKDLHYRFTALVNDAKRAARLLDMGCGFGKSTKPFTETLREAQITGVDIAAPCLKLAACDAVNAQTRNVRFLQKDATRTGLPDGGFDVVTSTMLLHEMAPPAIRDLIKESHRLLEPGGVAIHLDFLPPDDPFLQYVHFGHGQRNNEPWMEPLAKMNVEQAMRDAGFRNVRVMPFDEAQGAIDATYQRWRFPWTVIMGERA